MPTFPKYRGELPQCLSPLNLRHYWLLAYWVFFRPTALKCYLYQADPKLYRADGWLSLFRTLRVPAYRNLYLLMPVLSLLLSVLIGLPMLLLASRLQGISVNEIAIFWTLAVTFGVAIGMVIVVAFGRASGVASGLAYGIAFGVVSGLAIILAGVLFELVAGSAIDSAVVTISLAISIAIGLAGGLAIGWAIALPIFFIAMVVLLVAIVGSGIGKVIGLAIADVRGAAASVVIILIAIGLLIGVGVGVMRVSFFIFQFGSALCGYFLKVRHPLEWDELLVLPLPGTQRILSQRLQRDELDGLHFLSDVVRNPFQRWSAQRVLQTYLHNQVAPLRFLYTLLTSPNLNVYVFAPLTKQDWRQLPTTRQILLAELDRYWVDCTTDPLSHLLELLVSPLTESLRDRRQTPLTHFAGMLYHLLDEGFVKSEYSHLPNYRPIYAR